MHPERQFPLSTACKAFLHSGAVLVACYIVTALVAYLLGSIPTGYLVAKARGIDIRTVGSGNIGATNAFRVLGKPAGIFVLLVDGLKGFAACQFIGVLVHRLLLGDVLDVNSGEYEVHKIVGGFAAILGHNYTCWLKFKGGKGIATSAGVVLALLPSALLVAFIVWIILFVSTRYVSVASIAAAAVLPFAAWWFGRSRTLIIVAAAISLLAIYKHRSNIQRLMNGTENRIGKKKPQEEAK
jgi:acyl phosphate:glycerol-3-phosphate acyltransferase